LGSLRDDIRRSAAHSRVQLRATTSVAKKVEVVEGDNVRPSIAEQDSCSTSLYNGLLLVLSFDSVSSSFDLKMRAVECRKILGVDKSTLLNWEQGRHEPNRENRKKILRFLG